MAFRRHLLELVSAEPRTASSLARELGLDRRDMEDDLRHMIRSARASGHAVVVEPARCKSCGFVFEEDRLSKPGRCPACRDVPNLRAADQRSKARLIGGNAGSHEEHRRR